MSSLLPVRVHIILSQWAARHNVSIESVVKLAVERYIESVDAGWTPPPPATPAYAARLRRSRDSQE